MEINIEQCGIKLFVRKDNWKPGCCYIETSKGNGIWIEDGEITHFFKQPCVTASERPCVTVI